MRATMYGLMVWALISCGSAGDDDPLPQIEIPDGGSTVDAAVPVPAPDAAMPDAAMPPPHCGDRHL